MRYTHKNSSTEVFLTAKFAGVLSVEEDMAWTRAVGEEGKVDEKVETTTEGGGAGGVVS